MTKKYVAKDDMAYRIRQLERQLEDALRVDDSLFGKALEKKEAVWNRKPSEQWYEFCAINAGTEFPTPLLRVIYQNYFHVKPDVKVLLQFDGNYWDIMPHGDSAVLRHPKTFRV
jgi:hypothetical protein